MSVWAIVVAAGNGNRFGGAKQFARLGNSTVLERSLATARGAVDQVVVVLAGDAQWSPSNGELATVGGATRSDSVRAGLALVPNDVGIVVVHDAARPFATGALYRSVIDAVRAGATAAVPGVAVADTIKRTSGVEVFDTLDRSDLVAVQTPQAFDAAALREAHAASGEGTDDAALLERAGAKVVVVDGEHRNFKITVAADLEMAAALLEAT